MSNFVAGLFLGAFVSWLVTWAVMKRISPKAVYDKVTGQLIRIEKDGRNFIDAAEHRLGL